MFKVGDIVHSVIGSGRIVKEHIAGGVVVQWRSGSLTWYSLEEATETFVAGPFAQPNVVKITCACSLNKYKTDGLAHFSWCEHDPKPLYKTEGDR